MPCANEAQIQQACRFIHVTGPNGANFLCGPMAVGMADTVLTHTHKKSFALLIQREIKSGAGRPGTHVF